MQEYSLWAFWLLATNAKRWLCHEGRWPTSNGTLISFAERLGALARSRLIFDSALLERPKRQVDPEYFETPRSPGQYIDGEQSGHYLRHSIRPI